MEFCVFQVENPLLSRQAMLEIQPCRSPDDLYQLPYLSQTIHVYNVCVGLLRRREILRCCLCWCKHWKVHILDIHNEMWYKERMKRDEDFLNINCSYSHLCQLVELDMFVLDYWKRRLVEGDLLNQVISLERLL